MNGQKKIAIVTGGNRGIGFEIVRQLIARDFEVVIAARDEQKGKAAAEKAGAHFIQLDVSNEKSILAFSKEVDKKFGRVDVLVNNAGMLESADLDLLTAKPALIATTFSVNAIGPLLLSQALVPLMKKGSRIINISSGGGSMTDEVGGWAPVYCISKSLLNAITRQLAHALEGKGVAVNSVCPGWVRTDMGGRNAPRSVEQGADTVSWLASESKIPSGKFFRDRKEIPF